MGLIDYQVYLRTLASIRNITGSLVIDGSGRYFGQTWDKTNFVKPLTEPVNTIYEIGYDTKYGRTFVTIPNTVKLVYEVKNIKVTINENSKLLKFAKDYDDGESPHRMFIVQGDPFDLQNKTGEKVFFEISW